MSSRKSIWAGMDRLEGKKEGSSYANLEKEQKRQGYKAKGQALRKHIEKAHKEGKTSLDYHQSRSVMRHVNKPN